MGAVPFSFNKNALVLLPHARLVTAVARYFYGESSAIISLRDFWVTVDHAMYLWIFRSHMCVTLPQDAPVADGVEQEMILSVNRTTATLFVDSVPYPQSIDGSVDDCASSDAEPCTLHVGQRVSTSRAHTRHTDRLKRLPWLYQRSQHDPLAFHVFFTGRRLRAQKRLHTVASALPESCDAIDTTNVLAWRQGFYFNTVN